MHRNIDQCIHEIEYTKGDILSTFDRINSKLDDTIVIGEKTEKQLDDQGKQLDNIEEKLTGINTNLRTSQKIMNGMKSFFGFGHLTRSGVKDVKITKVSNVNQNEITNIEDKKKLLETTKEPISAEFRDNRFEKEFDDACTNVQDKLSILKEKSLTIREKITNQNDQLDIINAKTDRTNINIKNMDTKIRDLL